MKESERERESKVERPRDREEEARDERQEARDSVSICILQDYKPRCLQGTPTITSYVHSKYS